MAATFLRLSAAPANCRVSCHLACGTAGLRRVYEGRAPFMPNLCNNYACYFSKAWGNNLAGSRHNKANTEQWTLPLEGVLFAVQTHSTGTVESAMPPPDETWLVAGRADLTLLYPKYQYAWKVDSVMPPLIRG